MMKMFEKKRYKRYIYIIISGILFSAPFIFPELNILAFITGIPFYLILFDELLNNKNKRYKLTRYAVVFGMSFYLPVYIWFLWMYPMEYTGVTPVQSAFIAAAAWVGFPVLQTFVLIILPLGLGLFGGICRRNTKDANILFLPVLTACLYVIAEWVQSWFFSGLTWAKLSVSQYKNLFFIQSISLFGTYFVSFIIVFINAAVALYILNRTNKTIPASKNNILILGVIILYLANSYFGFFRLMYYDYAKDGKEKHKITAQVVQGNISSYEKWESAGIGNSLNKYISLTEKYIGEIGEYTEKINISVWPETAIPTNVYQGGNLYEYLRNFSEQNNITLFTGAFYYLENNVYNAIVAFAPNHDFIKPYGKRHLVPFGEYLPAEKLVKSVFPFVANMAMFDSVLTPGESSGIMEINGVNYGGLVCFDSIFPELARQSVKDGADILIIITNDSWFRDSPAIYQHNAQAVLRAVENKRYVIRAANTGISSIISPTGEIIRQSDALVTDVLIAKAGIIKDKTVYTVFGDVILYLSWAYIAFCVGWLVKIRCVPKA